MSDHPTFVIVCVPDHANCGVVVDARAIGKHSIATALACVQTSLSFAMDALAERECGCDRCADVARRLANAAADIAQVAHVAAQGTMQ